MITVLSLVFMVVIGVAIIIATSILYSASSDNYDVAQRGLIGVAATFITIGTVGFAAVMTLWFSCPLLFFGAFALLVAWIRLIAIRREELLRILAAAAERGVPLSYAATAFAAERPGQLDAMSSLFARIVMGRRLRALGVLQADRLGRQANHLATLLEGGSSLTEAINQTLTGLSTSTLVAVRMGEPLNNFGPALSQSLGANRIAETAIRSMVERFMYFYFLFLAIQFPLTFTMVKIMPVFEKMFREYDLKLPVPTQILIAFSYYWFRYGAIFYSIIIGIGFFAMVYYLGLLPRNVPILSRFLFPYDRTQVLRVLSWSVRAGKPLTSTFNLIAEQYPRNLVRRRMRRASRLLQEGQDWCDSLQAARFLKSADVAVLHAAERAGNLPWALETLADSHVRRLVYRLRTFSTFLFPCFTLLLGAMIGFFCLGMFLPLVDLITKLS